MRNRIRVGTSILLRSSVKSVSENALMQKYEEGNPTIIPWSPNELKAGISSGGTGAGERRNHGREKGCGVLVCSQEQRFTSNLPKTAKSGTIDSAIRIATFYAIFDKAAE
jgi:hypothetical protein